MKKMKGVYRPDAAVPQCFSTPSTAAAIALPFSAALSIRAIASYRHLAMSSSAMTSPFSTTGKCLNLPGAKGNFSGDITRTAGKVRKKKMSKHSHTLHHLLQCLDCERVCKHKYRVPGHDLRDRCLFHLQLTSNHPCGYVLASIVKRQGTVRNQESHLY